MKVHLFGKQLEIKIEFAVAAGAVLILLGCLAGYLLSRDDRDIIIETDSAAVAETHAKGTPGSSAAGTGNGGSPGTSAGLPAAASSGVPFPAAGMSPGNSPGNIAQAATGAAVSAPEQIRVYVVGCVRQPGIVTLEKGAVIDDAVRKAGGLTEDADPGSINMVYRLNDNVMLSIKSKKESGTSEKRVTGAAEPGRAAKTGETSDPGNGVKITDGSGNSTQLFAGGNGGSGGEAPAGTGGTGGTGGAGTVNINTADAAELDGLPGVGEATAREIIAFREKNGPFRRIEDIMKVPRIKQGRFDSIKERISVN